MSRLDYDRPSNTASQATCGFLDHFVCRSTSVSIDVTWRLRGIVLHGECMIWYAFTPATGDSSPGYQQQAKLTGTRKKKQKQNNNNLPKRNFVTSIYRLRVCTFLSCTSFLGRPRCFTYLTQFVIMNEISFHWCLLDMRHLLEIALVFARCLGAKQ